MIDYNATPAAGASPTTSNVAAGVGGRRWSWAGSFMPEPRFTSPRVTLLVGHGNPSGFDSSSRRGCCGGTTARPRPKHSAGSISPMAAVHGVPCSRRGVRGERQDRDFSSPSSRACAAVVRCGSTAPPSWSGRGAGQCAWLRDFRALENLLDHPYEEVKNFRRDGARYSPGD